MEIPIKIFGIKAEGADESAGVAFYLQPLSKSNIQFRAPEISRARIEIAPELVPAYSNGLMGQQHRVTVKRKRRKAYVERKRVLAKAPRPAAAKTRAKKTAASES
jgi:hypothetical protein